jgi:hypothetical protein
MNDASDDDRTASLMTPAKLAQLQTRPKPAATPAAWLDQLASDAGSGHVRRLVDLRGQLEGHAAGVPHGALAAALDMLSTALEQVDFALLQPKGWLARATGRGKEAASGFVSQAGRVERAGEDLADEVRALQKKQAASGTAVERTLMEIEVELRAIEKIMDQGARWLQDMRGQLKQREKQGGDAAVQKQIAEDTARCELLVARLKQLRATTSAGHALVEQSREAAKSRAGLAASVQNVLETPWKSWQQKVAPLVDAATAGGSASDGVERAREVQQQLLATLRQARNECSGVATREEALAQALQAAQQPLQAAS